VAGLISGVAPGLYTLRADEIGAAGDVFSRIETPFQRVARPPPRRAPGATASPGMRRRRRAVAVTIQPGDTLWAISENRYGAGIRYVQVYRANRDRIRDPDLIYPGQVFDLPELGAVGLTVAYGVARLMSVGFQQLRDAVFARVAQRALRQLALETFQHIHALSCAITSPARPAGSAGSSSAA
jgi:hypothetical protein